MPPKPKVSPYKMKNPGGKPARTDVTHKEVYDLATIHCTIEEIAAVLGTTRDHIYTKHADALRRGHENGQMSLKRKMHKVALEGDTKMLIWLSKQRLGYKEQYPDIAQQVHFNIITQDIPVKAPEIIDIHLKELVNKGQDHVHEEDEEETN